MTFLDVAMLSSSFSVFSYESACVLLSSYPNLETWLKTIEILGWFSFSSSIEVFWLKTESIKSKSIIVMIAVSLMRKDRSGIMHWRIVLMPSVRDFKGALIVLIRSMKILLFDLSGLGSFRPGVSIKVIFSLVSTLTQWVTADTDLDALNLIWIKFLL